MDKTTYKADESIVVDYVGLPGNKKDWIGVFKKDADNNDSEEYHYTNKSKTGSMEFDALPAGKYEARLFYDKSFDMIEKISFEVKALSMDKTTFDANETIVVDYAGLPGNKKDWIDSNPEKL